MIASGSAELRRTLSLNLVREKELQNGLGKGVGGWEVKKRNTCSVVAIYFFRSSTKSKKPCLLNSVQDRENCAGNAAKRIPFCRAVRGSQAYIFGKLPHELQLTWSK